MLRLLNVATVVMVLICIAISASIALADGRYPSGSKTMEAAETAIDIYEFDFPVAAATAPHPEYDLPASFLDI